MGSSSWNRSNYSSSRNRTVYVWGQKLNNDSKVVPATPVTQTQTTPAVTEQPKDEFSDMEANLNASVEGLDDANF